MKFIYDMIILQNVFKYLKAIFQSTVKTLLHMVESIVV